MLTAHLRRPLIESYFHFFISSQDRHVGMINKEKFEKQGSLAFTSVSEHEFAKYTTRYGTSTKM